MEKFNAQWAAVGVRYRPPVFPANLKRPAGMHKNDLADAYTLFLYNDPETAKPLISAALGIMSFLLLRKASRLIDTNPVTLFHYRKST